MVCLHPMCRKPYLHFKSHHPNHVKRRVVRCLYQRARRVTNMSENLKEEEKHLHKMVMTTQPLGQVLKSYLLKIT